MRFILNDGCFHSLHLVGLGKRFHSDLQDIVLAFVLKYLMHSDLELFGVSRLSPHIFGVGVDFPHLEGRVPVLGVSFKSKERPKLLLTGFRELELLLYVGPFIVGEKHS